MRLGLAVWILTGALGAAAAAAPPVALQRPDDGINTPQSAPDPMLDRPLALPSGPLLAKPPAKPRAKPAPGALAAAAAKPEGKQIAVGLRQCADSYFAGASLLRAEPQAMDLLLHRAQIAGEAQLRANPGTDQAKLVQAIKMSGMTRAAEINALDSAAGPKAAEALFHTIRQCDAKLNLSITGQLAFGAPPPTRPSSLAIGARAGD